jgi:hypothetical protein
MVLARRIRRSGLGLPGDRVVVVGGAGAGAGRSEVAGATVGVGSCRAAGACLAGEQPTSTAATTAKPKIRRILVISRVVPRGGRAHNLVGAVPVGPTAASVP